VVFVVSFFKKEELVMDIKWRKEEGTVIVVAVFVVLALVVVGSLAVMLTNIELDISRNDRFGKEAFFVADAGCPISTKIIREMILNEGVNNYTEDYYNKGINFHKDDPDLLLNEIRNYYSEPYDPTKNDWKDDNPDDNPDITATVSGRDLNIDVDWRYKKSGAGGSLLFAMGYEGIGADRSHGGVKIYYDIHNKGKVSKNITAEIDAVYLSQ